MKKQAIVLEKALLRPFFGVLIFCLALTSSVGTAQSLYLVGNSSDSGWDTIWVYDVQPNGKLIFSKTGRVPDEGSSRVNGLAVDPNSNTLFITDTGGSTAATVNTDSLEFRGFIYLVPWDMLAGGIAYDAGRSRVYVTDDLKKTRLIIYDWVPAVNGLHNVELAGTDVPVTKPVAGAITFGPEKKRVYVASEGSGIEVLQTGQKRADWQTVGFLESAYEVRTLSVDARNQYLYAGGRTEKAGFITRYRLVDGTSIQKKVTDHPDDWVLSLCVDGATSLVYVLSGNIEIPNRKLRIYDRSFNILQELTVIGDPRRLHVPPGTSVVFNPLNLTVDPVSGTVEKNGREVALPGAEIQYEICMGNTNLFPVTNIILTNSLPPELEFVRAKDLGSASGVFDELSGTYFYQNPSLEPGSTQCFSIVARVKENVAPGTVITTTVVADSNETAQSVASVDVDVESNALVLDKTVVMDPNYLVVGDVIYVDPGAFVTYQICLNNLNNLNPVSNVLVIDELSDLVEFVSAEQVGSISHYDASTHSFSWAFNEVAPNYLDCFDITVRIKDNVVPGQIISNKVLVGGSETSTTTAQVDVVVKYDALFVDISILNLGDYNPVTNQVVRGGILTYAIDVNNFDPRYPAKNVVVIDSVPEGLQFVAASLGGANGVYDPLSRTFTYKQPVLGPGQGIHMELTFLVDAHLPGGTVLVNSVIALANGAPASTDSVSVSVDVDVEPNPLVLDKTVVMDPNYLVVGDVIYVDSGAFVTYQICLNNLDNLNPVSNVLVTDELSDLVEFVSAEQVGSISHYDASTHSFSWAFNEVAPNYFDCFDITVRIKDNVVPGQIISNKVSVGGSETSTTTAQVDVVVKYDALFVDISIANTGDYSPVTNQIVRSGILTYIIDVSNFNPRYPAENVVVIDSVPEGLQFVAAFPGGANGVYDELSRTYTYQQPVVGPGQRIHMELTFLVDDDLPDNTVLTNSVIAMANGAPASTDSVSVSVFGPHMIIVPTTLDLFYTAPLRRQDPADDIMAVMRMPDSIGIEEIDTTQALMMTPGPSPAFYIDSVEEIPTIYYMYIGYDGSLNVKGFFNRKLVLNALQPGQSSVTITVTGSLKTGQSFVGQSTVPVN